MSTFAGGCLCGSIRYEVRGGPHTSYSCHCRDCQYISGGPPNSAIYIPDADLSLVKGTPASYSSTSDAGFRITRYFCGNCGTHIYGESEMFQDSVVLKVGSLDEPSVFESTMNVWVSSAQPWHYLDPELPKFETKPT